MGDVYKRCKACAQLFISTPLSLNQYCPTHAHRFNAMLLYQIHTYRCIPIDWLNIYDQNEHHLCRICGNPVMTKTGKYSERLRYCRSAQCKNRAETFFREHTWAYSNFIYLQQLHPKQESQIINAVTRANLDMYWHLTTVTATSIPFFSLLYCCEQCGQLCCNGTYIHHPSISHFEVHHKIPVYRLTIDNYMLCFDLSNLILLCTQCHDIAHASLNGKSVIDHNLSLVQHNHRLDTFFPSR